MGRGRQVLVVYLLLRRRHEAAPRGVALLAAGLWRALAATRRVLAYRGIYLKMNGGDYIRNRHQGSDTCRSSCRRGSRETPRPTARRPAQWRRWPAAPVEGYYSRINSKDLLKVFIAGSVMSWTLGSIASVVAFSTRAGGSYGLRGLRKDEQQLFTSGINIRDPCMFFAVFTCAAGGRRL